MKRSSQVALLVMGVAGVGASAYAFAPSNRNCAPPSAPPAASAATAITSKDPKLEPCPARRSYTSNTGYYRSHWYSSSPTHWSTPIFARRTGATTTAPPSTNSPTSLGFTRPGSTTTSRPSTTTPTTRTGFGTIGHSIAAHSTSS